MDDLEGYEDIRAYLRAKRREYISKDKMEVAVKLNSVFKCSKCNSRNVKEKPMQLRSADEGMDTNCICLDCKNNWIIRN